MHVNQRYSVLYPPGACWLLQTYLLLLGPGLNVMLEKLTGVCLFEESAALGLIHLLDRPTEDHSWIAGPVLRDAWGRPALVTWAGPLGPSLALEARGLRPSPGGGGCCLLEAARLDGEAELRALMPLCCAKAPGAISGWSPPQSRGEMG